jgi:hypothetical protein
MTLRIALIAAALAGGPALAQENTALTEALGTFDQIAVQCARGGSEADIDAYRLKLWRAYLAGANGSKIESNRDIQDMIDALRKRMDDEASVGMRKQYWAARIAIPQARSLSDAQEQEFYRLCESPKVQGLPDKK